MTLSQMHLTTVCSFAGMLSSQTVPVRSKSAKKQSPGLFFERRLPPGVQFSLIDSIKKIQIPKRHLYFLMEARRIELLSENLFTAGSPSAVCVHRSLSIKHTNKLYASVASLFMGGSKLCRHTFTAGMTLFSQVR